MEGMSLLVFEGFVPRTADSDFLSKRVKGEGTSGRVGAIHGPHAIEGEFVMNNVAKLIIAVAAPVVIGGLSGLATARGVSTWYPTLVKPSFNPPAWVFGPVWTVLYIMMGVAAYLVWRHGIAADGVRMALAVFVVQLALNGLWSILFFGMQSPGWALVEIAVLWCAIGATIWPSGA